MSFPLSPAQLSIWHAQHLDPFVPITIAQYVDIRGAVDASILERTCGEAGAEYGSGFLRLLETGDEVRQVVDPDLAYVLEQVDLRAAEAPVAAAEEWMRADRSRPMDLLGGRLIRTALLRIADDRWFWYSCAHHIMLDGFGAAGFTARVAELYTCAVLGTEPPPFRALDLRALYDAEIGYRESTRFHTDRKHWAQRVAGWSGHSGLTGRTAPPSAVSTIDSAHLSAAQEELLAAAVQRHCDSPAGVLIAAFAAYLAQMTQSPNVVLSLPVTARTTAAMRRSGGTVANIVPLRLHIGFDTTVAELLRQVRVEISGALRHQRYRHEDMRRDAGRSTSDATYFGPWINVMLFDTRLRFGTAAGTFTVLSTGSIEDLAVNIYPGRDGTRIDFESNPEVYGAGAAGVQHRRFLEFLGGFLAAGGEVGVWRLPVVPVGERDRMVVEWNRSGREVPATTLVALLDEQIARTPERTALRFEGTSLS
ncbi:condensation domain-containing protein, partial [Nocardia jiangsuensis]